jgi:type I restriction enzyme S subunit
MIPDDWNVQRLGSMVDEKAAIRYGVVQIGPNVADGVPIVPIKYVKEIGTAQLHRSSKSIEEKYSGSRVTGSDVLISVKGTIGRVGVVPEGFEGNIAREIARIRLRKGFSPSFVAFQLESDETQRRIFEAVVGTTRLEFSIAAVRNFPIAIPKSLQEQHSIAEALSDADARIAAVEALIAKKCDIKRAVMQRLLTGKTRLPGFSGAWEVKRLGELLDYEQPTKHLVHSTEYDDSYDIPVLTAGKSFYLGRTNETFGVCRNLPVIIFDDFTTATQFVDFPFKAKSSAMKLLRPKEQNTNIRLVYALMQGIKFTMSDHKRYWISEYQEIELPFPGPEEQIAISTILSDMDAELAALKADAEKARMIKQGMMQNLLTGKVRLV